MILVSFIELQSEIEQTINMLSHHGIVSLVYVSLTMSLMVVVVVFGSDSLRDSLSDSLIGGWDYGRLMAELG